MGRNTTSVRDAADAFPNSRAERPIASCATISVIIGRIPDGDKHRFVNYDFPSPNLTGRASRIPIVRGKLLNRLAPKGGLLFLHYFDVLPPDGSDRFTQSECPLGQLQIVCRKRHQIFGHARLRTLLGEPYAPFGERSTR